MGELGLTIDQLVADALPAGFVVSEAYVQNRLRVWQTGLWEAANVDEASKYEISAYTDDWHILLSYLIVYDTLSRVLSGNFTSVLDPGTDTEEGGGGVKKIVTGPTEVEFHDTTTALAKLLTAMNGENGIFNQFLITACAFAGKLGVQLPFCARRNTGGCISIVKPRFPHAGYNGITRYGQNKPKSVG